MATRSYKRLTDRKVKALSKPGAYPNGRYADGDGLYLQIRGGSASWVFRFRFGKPKPGSRHGHNRYEMGLGPVRDMTLAEARTEVGELRKLIRAGRNPIDQRRLSRDSRPPTFDEAAKAYIDEFKTSWRNPKHAAQWQSTLDTYASPVIGDLPVNEIDQTGVERVLNPIWQTKTETASRVRGRIERVLDWARVKSYRTGDNPARWKGHLEHVFPKRSAVRKVAHHPALPWAELPAFMATLSERDSQSSDALRLTILTAARSGEIRFAKWMEFDLDAETPLWIVPADRMKSHREHRIPLSRQAADLLRGLRRRKSGYLFDVKRKPLSESAMLMLLRRMEFGNITVHGFRSTFRDWVAEKTSFSRDLAELSLAHVNKDRVEAAYLRGDALEKRAELMQAWADFACSTDVRDKVITIRSA